MPEYAHHNSRIEEDHYYMDHVLALAKKGIGHVNPNPLVGAVIVQDGEVIGQGHHRKFGEHHAEINAITNIRKPINNATLYVNLEPCSHVGKTGSCAQEIIKYAFKRVVIANEDPNPLVNGKGIKIIRDSGIQVDIGIQKDEAREMNHIFFKWIKNNKPFVLLKTATSLDGKIATMNGNSKWISGEQSRTIVHQLRHQYSAVLTGVNTVIYDDPLFNVRRNVENPAHPARIILDPKARTPLHSKILHTPEFGKVYLVISNHAPKNAIENFRSKGAEIIVCPLKNQKMDLHYLLNVLKEKNIDSIMIEAGGYTNFECIQQNVVDRLLIFLSPQIIGGEKALTAFEGKGFKNLNETKKIKSLKHTRLAEDIMIEAEINNE